MEFVQLTRSGRGEHFYTTDELNAMKTRVLLKELRATHSIEWDIEYRGIIEGYQSRIKAVLATREHIPSKQESKQLRKARIKKGR